MSAYSDIIGGTRRARMHFKCAGNVSKVKHWRAIPAIIG
jgi:hypothetical protein